MLAGPQHPTAVGRIAKGALTAQVPTVGKLGVQMYDVELQKSWFPAQGRDPQMLITVGEMLRRSAIESC